MRKIPTSFYIFVYFNIAVDIIGLLDSIAYWDIVGMMFFGAAGMLSTAVLFKAYNLG